MHSDTDRLRYGYWPARQMSGEIPAALENVEDYDGSEVLNIACTQTGLAASAQRRLVDKWIHALPSVPATTIMFSTKVSQELFDAAANASRLEALSVKWSSLKSLGEIGNAKNLRALFLGSSPSVADLNAIASLSGLEYLFIENVAAPVNLGFLTSTPNLREFGISAVRGRKIAVESLAPITSLAYLEMLWLISVKVDKGGLRPLHSLRKLRSLRSTLRRSSQEFQDLCEAVPTLEYFQGVG